MRLHADFPPLNNQLYHVTFHAGFLTGEVILGKNLLQWFVSSCLYISYDQPSILITLVW